MKRAHSNSRHLQSYCARAVTRILIYVFVTKRREVGKRIGLYRVTARYSFAVLSLRHLCNTLIDAFG